MADQRLCTLNRAYYLGEYEHAEYRNLRALLIDEITYRAPKDDPTEQLNNVTTPTLNMRREDIIEVQHAPLSEVETQKASRGPSVLQFLWVSITVLLFIYMYTATAN